jgi:glycosyltransferase involved in cell wall biosynthesis
VKRIANLVFSKVSGDGRVQRQVQHAAREFAVDVIAAGSWVPDIPNVSFHSIQRSPISRVGKRVLQARLLGGRLAHRLWEDAFWSFRIHRDALSCLLSNGPFDIIHANDVEALPVAVRAAEQMGAKVVFDAHEYHPGQAKFLVGRRRWTHLPYVSYLLREYLPRVDAFFTTSPGFARLYKENFGFEPLVILNAPELVQVSPRSVNPNSIRLVHHGAAKPAREPDKFIRMMEYLDERYTLDLMLVRDSNDYFASLESMAASIDPGRIKIRSAVAPGEIVSAISEYDIGVHTLPPIGLNHIYPLPNKLFEFMGAGLAVVIGPCPEMAKIVNDYKVGVVADDHTPKALAKAVSSLDASRINDLKGRSIVAARIFNAEVEMQKLVTHYMALAANDQVS